MRDGKCFKNLNYALENRKFAKNLEMKNAHHGKLFARATTDGCLSDMSSFMHFA